MLPSIVAEVRSGAYGALDLAGARPDPDSGVQTKRRGPGPLEEPFPSGPRAFRFRWRGLTPQWPRSLRLGSASRSNLARSPSKCNPFASSFPHLPKKTSRRRPGPAHVRVGRRSALVRTPWTGRQGTDR
jgi:hypothetical protein